MVHSSKNYGSFLKIFSFYNQNVSPDIPKYQGAVFRHFGLSINQILGSHIGHGDFLNHVCRTVTDADYIVVFDIDCVPVRRDWLKMLLDDLLEPQTIVGAAQTANHLRNARNLYVSPFFFAVAVEYLRELQYPNMKGTAGVVDNGQNLSEHIIQAGGTIKYWWPTHIEEERWYLHHPVHNRFGLGTTYNDAIYHAFRARSGLSDRFVRKCQSILP